MHDFVLGLTALNPSVDERRRARSVLMSHVTGKKLAWEANAFTEGLIQLDPSAAEKSQARKALIKFLQGVNEFEAESLIRTLVKLDPCVDELTGWRAWAHQPTSELTATVRRNSTFPEWLKALPDLAYARDPHHPSTKPRPQPFIPGSC